MDIILCLKVVPKAEDVRFDAATKTLDRSKAENEINPADKNAVEVALQLKEKYGGKVSVVSMGPPLFEAYMKLAVAMGCDDAILLSDRAFAGADTYATSIVLAEAVKKIGRYDLVVCGEESSDASTGQVPAGIAEWLGIPQALYVSATELGEDGMLKARRTLRGGYEVVALPLPALISVELGVNSPRFPDFRRKRWADKEFKLTVWNREHLGLDENHIGLKGSKSIVHDLIESKPPMRKREFIKGTPQEEADQLLQRILPLLES